MARYIDSSSRTYDEYERQRTESQSDAILDIGVGIGSVYGASKFIESDVGQNISKRLFKLNTVNTYFADRNSTYTDWKIKNRITLGDIVLDTSKVLEEISPLKILRTFHVSSFISPYTIPKANLAEISITKDQMLIDEIYIRSLIKKVNPNASASLINELFNEGAIFREGKLLTQKGDEVLANARLVKLNPSPEANLGSTEHPFINRVYQKFRNLIGDRDDSGFYKNIKSPKGGYGIIAGRSEASMALDWARAYGRLAIEPGFKLFDRPMDVLAEIIDKTELDKRINIPHNLREKLYLGAGAGGDYTQSVPGMFKSMAKNITRLTIGGALAYNVANEALELLPEDSPYSKGVTEGLATTYVSARLGIAELWSDNFQDYKTKQEELAPGSTSLATLVGFPLAGALLGANIGYFQRVADATVNNVAAADTRALRESTSNIVNNLSGQKINPKLNRVGKYSAIGAMLATIPIIPFLPGALIGESSENLEAIYSGEEDVAIRSTRFWGSGGGPMEGGKIKYYTKSWYHQLMNNSETAGIYGDDDTRDELNPVLNPFDYLRNPYRLEERNQDKSPYAVWGMEVSYGGAFGKLFQGTVGALIKPDVVNKRLEDYAEKESDGTFTIKTQVSESEASLVEEGLMLAPESASLNVEKELLHTSYSALTDFAGLKGWITSLASEAVHSGVGDPGLQLDRSGAMLNSARSIQESNLGGMGPLGESLRRFIPTNSGSILDRANPLRNQTPEWLPHDVSNYWIDFSTGDQFQKIEKGYFRLPGEGYALQNKELEGVDPNDYPFIHRYKILSDVAMGSDEYYHYKDIIEARASNNQLTDYELDLFNKINYQTSKRSVKKEFYSNENDGLVSRYWKSITSASELPTESLTFLRPSAKLIHKRTALEDYYATQVDGTDTGMWTKPYEHFIKPAINKSLQSEEMPEETQDKRAVNEYFDKLEYIKQRRLYKKSIEDGDGQSYLYKNKYQKTLTGALASGLDENMEITRAYIALPDQEKAYFAEFSSATSESDRTNIIKAESAPIAELYSKIWKRRDAIVENYQDPTSQAEAINSIVEKESSELARSNPLMYAQYRSSKDQEHSSFAEFVADKEAEAYISKTTGMPSEGFAGWDPRIDIKDIKLRTLMIGKEDVRSFGFWEGDEERLKRLVVLNDENQVSGQIDEIKAGIREEKSRIAMIKNDLYKRGISVDSVDFFTSKTDDINLQIGA